MGAAFLIHAPGPRFWHNLRVDLDAAPIAALETLAEARRTGTNFVAATEA